MTRTQKHWRDLALWQKIAVIIGGAVQFALLGTALWDLRNRPPNEINGSKELWTVVSFINFIGPVSYFLFGIKRQPGQALPLFRNSRTQSGGE